MAKKRASFRTIFLVMIITLVIASLWNKIPLIGKSVNYFLGPTFGALLNWNLYIGMILITAIISILTTLIQKYTTDQEALKELKKKQKELQKEIKKFQQAGNQTKAMELQKESMKAIPETFKLSMGSLIYTGIPFILFIRWFQDYFALIENFKFFGFMTWFWFYLILLMIIGGILRKILKVA